MRVLAVTYSAVTPLRLQLPKVMVPRVRSEAIVLPSDMTADSLIGTQTAALMPQYCTARAVSTGTPLLQQQYQLIGLNRQSVPLLQHI